MIKKILLSVLVIFICSFNFAVAAGVKSPDAIAVRVMPNTQHFSASRWYGMQGFSGSPQTIEVDGYEAVRDGRSVYVDAANISGNKLYTNIYIISYNQNSEDATSDIFSELLMHWTFNQNIRDTGECSINAARCSLVKDCQKGQSCLAGFCKQDVVNKCVVDTDCLTGTFCTSKKAKTVRDTRRLSDISEMRLALETYNRNKKTYPKLESGTYLTGRTISVWPSWISRFSQDLGGYAVDPVNVIGQCSAAYNQSTCWDENRKTFSGAVPVSAAKNTLPAGSIVYSYSSMDNGSNYSLCATMESGFMPSLYCLGK